MKNIVFDLGGVVLVDKPKSVLNDLNVDESTYNNLLRFFSDWEKLDLGEETLEKKYISCNFPKEYDSLYKKLLVNYYEYRAIDSRLISCIKLLKNNGYNIYILSDNNKECYEYYKDNIIFKDIDGWVLSCEYHTIKRESKLFDIFLDKFNLNSNECYFVDDKISLIEEAKKHGINGCVFSTNDDINKLYDDMRNSGINI